MTTLAKIEANKRNAELSTGPRTVAGKVIVARNATTHGIYSSVPVVPGECPEAWEAHRAGVVESLASVGLLEVNLAERAALVLWRLQRLARYEVETVAAMEDAEVPPLPPPDDEVSELFPKPVLPTREDQLRDLTEELRTARRELADVSAARDLLSTEPGTDAVVPFGVAESILETACNRAEAAEDLRSDPTPFGGRALLKKLELIETDTRAVTWTAGLIRRALDLYAGYAQEPVAEFTAVVRSDLEVWAAERARKVRRLEREVGAITRLLDTRTERKRTAKLLPGDGRDERIAKYERHLHNLLTSTLHELERLRVRREGAVIPPPVVADVRVTVDASPD